MVVRTKLNNVFVIAITGELAVFMWAVAQEVKAAAKNNYPGYWQGWGPGQANPRYCYWIGVLTTKLQLIDRVSSKTNQCQSVTIPRISACSPVVTGSSLFSCHAYEMQNPNKTGAMDRSFLLETVRHISILLKY